MEENQEEQTEEKQPYQSKKEARQEKKNAEEGARKRQRLVSRLRNFAITAVVLVVIGFGLYLLLKGAAPQGEDLSQEISVMEALHIEPGNPLPEYTSDPPTSGPHYTQTVRSDFREEALPDQNIIHNLEHGDIWISYNPRIPDAIREDLKQFGAAKVVITPREANETDIALAAWGRLDTFNVEGDTLPIERIEDFIKRYTNQGPEQVPGASGGI
jgi:hypothetical protein